MANKALINYYAKLVARGDKKMEEVPDEHKEDVKARMKEIKENEERMK